MKARRTLVAVAVLGILVVAYVATRQRPSGETKRWTGTVADRNNMAIRGARVTLMAGEVDALIPVGEPVTTDRRGRFLIEIPSDRPYALMAEMEGFATEYEDADPRRRISLQLSASRTLTGRVLAAPDRVPVANATVLAQTMDEYGWRNAVKTDAEGRYRLERIDVDASEFIVIGPAAMPYVEEIEGTDARELEHDFVLPEEPTIRGRVIDLESGKPVAGASIVPLHLGNDMPYREIVRSAADGTFEITSSSTWNGVGIEVRKDGYARSRRELDDPSWAEVSSSIVTMGLLRECVLEGTVTDEYGAPVAGATIWTTSGDLSDAGAIPISIPAGLIVRHYGAIVSHTDRDGRYRLTNLLPMMVDGRVIMSTHEVHAGNRLPAFSAPGQSARMDWIAPRDTSVIEGRVSVNGDPVVAIVSWSSGAYFGDLEDGDRQSSKKGRFRTEPIPPGKVQLRVDVDEGFAPHVVSIDVPPATIVERDIDLTVDLGRIEGAVSVVTFPFRGGTWPTDAERVTLDPSEWTQRRITATRSRDGLRLESTLDSEGRFAFLLPDAKWDAWKVALDGSGPSVTTHSGATAVSLMVLRKRDD